MRIALVDTVYPQFLASLPPLTESYDAELVHLMDRRFGTFDAYSYHLRMLGWDVIDIVANHAALQNLWLAEQGLNGFPQDIAREQIRQFRPDVVFVQDLSFFSANDLRELKSEYVLAGQCSCRFDDTEKLKHFDVLFSSFPFYVDRFNALGVKGVYLPLAFDPRVLEQTQSEARTLASFVGGFGKHWETDELFTVLAERTPIAFWGYGYEKAPEAVRKRWRGPAWGREMYTIYGRSHIVLNRHGGISHGLSNNLRLFEATGMGAMLLTEESPNIREFFGEDGCARYTSPADAAEKINYYLDHPAEMLQIASKGQAMTLSKHTYSQRMPLVSETLKALVASKVAA